MKTEICRPGLPERRTQYTRFAGLAQSLLFLRFAVKNRNMLNLLGIVNELTALKYICQLLKAYCYINLLKGI